MKKTLALILALAMALSTVAFAEAGAQTYTPGTYTASAQGRVALVPVTVTVSETEILSVEVGENSESEGISELPIVRIPADIVANQSLGVDMVGGATMTSRAIITAAADALAQAGADVKALYAAPVAHEVPACEDMSAQVVVVGGGMSGLVAAVTAAEQGADVVLVEKMSHLGGTLIIAGGGMVTVNSALNGDDIDDSLETFMAYFKNANETSVRQPDYEFLENFVVRTGEAVDYLVNAFGVDAQYKGGAYGRTYVTNGPVYAKVLADLCEKNGVKVLLDTKAEHICMNEGSVCGIVVSNAAGEYTIAADKVIIAAGGAGYDRERMLASNPELAVIDFYNEAPVSNTGDGFKMLEEVGAQMADGPFIKSANPDVSPVFGYTFKNSPAQAGTLVVNAEGKRFANEAPIAATMFNTFMLREASPAYYALYQADKMSETFLADCEALAPRGVNSIVVKADTIDGIAELINVDAAVLNETYARYQEACAKGEDTEFGKAADKLAAYTDGEAFYAVRVYPGSWGTIGGAITDETFHVVDGNGNLIPNLYAVGECATSKLFGDYYFGGFSLGFYTAMGYIAGTDAAASVK